ncbi:hypothetical protein [Dongia deserti]|uniref:hypothetical protein n=1 Tax=Dongia deserti TaxID=2268030 RepID=UPI000E64FC4E|nr:hypothetical protein [Dongia deserti]
MFLIDRPALSPNLRADLAPRQLFGSTGDVVRAALVARPPVTDPAAPIQRHPNRQFDFTVTAPTWRRKAV